MVENLNKIKLSIVIPCYNKSEYLIEMVECIMKQTFKDWELILVDDGSDDVNFNKVHKYVVNDTRIKHIRRNRLPKNGDTCRNIGMDMAKGEYLIIFDSDDLISDTCFEYRVKYMDEHPECDYATFPFASFAEGSPLPSCYMMNKIGQNNATILQELLKADYPFTVWANIYRTASAKTIMWDEKLYIYQDLDFMIQCEHGNLKHNYSNINKSDYFYRHFNNGNSVCNVMSESKVKSTNYLIKKIITGIDKREDALLLRKSFVKFLRVHFERLLNMCNSQYMDSFIRSVEEYYPIEAKEYSKIFKRIGYKTSGHYNQFRIQLALYQAFGNRFNRTMMLHEITKFFLRR